MIYSVCDWCQSFPDTYICCHPKNKWVECPYDFDDYDMEKNKHKCKYFKGKVFPNNSKYYIRVDEEHFND